LLAGVVLVVRGAEVAVAGVKFLLHLMLSLPVLRIQQSLLVVALERIEVDMPVDIQVFFKELEQLLRDMVG
jgi:uncharacterized membrane protein